MTTLGNIAFPSKPADVDERFLTAALRQANAIGDASVTSIAYRSIGAGMVGDSVRFTLGYDRPDAGPATIAAKFPAEDDVSRETAVVLRLYETEVGFYSDLSQSLAVRIPLPYFSAIDPASGEFLLLLEDLGPARGGNQLEGCDIDDALAAVRQAAAMHGPRWCDPGLRDIPWIDRWAVTNAQIYAALPSKLAEFHRRYDGLLEPELMKVCDDLGARITDYLELPLDRFCVTHGDYRLDNMLFDIKGGTERCGILDWQTCALGRGMRDVGYFLGAGIPIALRRVHEEELLNIYIEELARHGVAGYDWDAAWLDYRRGLFQGVLMAVFAAASVERTERGDAMFLSMARGACQLALDVDAFRALPRS